MNYTKGEWKVSFTSNGKRGVRNKGGYICFLPKVTHFPGQDRRYEKELEENKYNSYLIAAAPEMFERLCEVYDEGLDDRILMENIDKTLKKAEGEL